MISFRDTLADIVNNVGGGLGAVIMGYDGIASTSIRHSRIAVTCR